MKRLTAILLVICMMFTMVPSMAYADIDLKDDLSSYEEGLCEHHPVHEENCGYEPSSEKDPCSHIEDGEHDDSCYELICGYEEGEIEEDRIATNTDASEPHRHDDSCYELICQHMDGEHDRTCGYAPADEDKDIEETEGNKDPDKNTDEETEAGDDIPDGENLTASSSDAMKRRLTMELSTERVEYADEYGETQIKDDVIIIDANTTVWADGWYAVKDTVTIDRRVTVSGNVSLILMDKASLTVDGGINVSEDKSLTIYGQEKGNGELTAQSKGYGNSGIGGGDREAGGTIEINGGSVDAKGGINGAGIGGGKGGDSGALEISEGKAVVYASSISDKSNPDSWKGIVFEGKEGSVYGTVTPIEDFEVKRCYVLTIPVGSELIVSEDIELKVDGTIENNGELKVNGKLSGDGRIEPRLNAEIAIIDVEEKTYDGEPVSEEDVSYTYTGASVKPAITITWHSDDGEQLQQAPSDPGTYWVKVAADETGFYASAEDKISFAIEKASLAAPGDLSLISPESGKGLASWDEAANASSYIVQLYKEGQPFGTEVTTSETAYEFTVTEEGSYSFGVRALGDDRFYNDSPEAKSEVLDIYIDSSSDNNSNSSGSSSGGAVTGPVGVYYADGSTIEIPSDATQGTWEQETASDGTIRWRFRLTDGSYAAGRWIKALYNGRYLWYRTDSDGYLLGGWFTETDGNIYYLHPLHDGAFGYMYTGDYVIDGRPYSFSIGREQDSLPEGALKR